VTIWKAKLEKEGLYYNGSEGNRFMVWNELVQNYLVSALLILRLLLLEN